MNRLAPPRIQAALDEAYRMFRSDDRGALSELYPPLAEADPAMLGIGFVDTDGNRFSAGDSSVPFVLMSVAKPFTFAVACDRIGADEARARIGVNATGLPFDSLEAVERNSGPVNPMVNAGAIVTVGLLGHNAWQQIIESLSSFAGRKLSIDSRTFDAVADTNRTNRALAQVLDGLGFFEGDPVDTLDSYTRQCCVSVTSEDLATMGSTLANGGVNPVTGTRVVTAEACRAAVSVMITAGLYETSGDWLYRVQLPGKSGVSGGIVGVSPGRGAFATYSPRIDNAANSVRGQEVAVHLSACLELGILDS